jgi:hypothetical protein
VQLGLAIPPELQRLLRHPELAARHGRRLRAAARRRRVPARQGPPDGLLPQELWQYNDLDEQQSLAHTDALALGRSYLCLGTNPDDPEFPLVTIESPLEMATLRDRAPGR